MFNSKRRKRTKSDDIVDVIKTMSYAEMMEMGKQLYIVSNLVGATPISDDQFARIMYEWTRLESMEPALATKFKSRFGGVAEH